MKFLPTALDGVWVVEPEPIADERGSFARTFCVEEFTRAGLPAGFAQCSTSFNRKKGTLRGLHFQAAPHAEDKLVRCTSGAVFDVAVDLRRDSKSYGRWISQELTAENRRALFIPKGCAHGFQTLTDGAEVFYQISPAYQPASSRGIRWDDPRVAVAWPLKDAVISDRDRNLPTLSELT